MVGRRDLVVIGGSAGGLASLITLVEGLPPSFPACVLVVLHVSSESEGNLARILKRATHLPVAVAVDGQAIERGIFVAPLDHHLVVTPGQVRVTHGPKENGFRPAIDPLFRTAATAYESRVIGVVLSGGLDDGTYGLKEIKAHGGLAIVQDPDDAEVTSMPRSAITHVDVDYVLPATAIAPLLASETQTPRQGAVAMSESHDDPQLPGVKTDIAEMDSRLGPPSGLTCPDCGGALWQIEEGSLMRYQCHVGHRYSSESLLMHQDEHVEGALWTAVRALEERADLRRRMASQTEAAGLAAVSESFAEQAQHAEEQANQIRDVLARSEGRRPALDVEPEVLPARRKRTRQR